MDKLERLDKRIEELASEPEYREKVSKLSCLIGIKTQTALSVIAEVGDFKRFSSARHFASYIGLVPGEDSSGGDQFCLPSIFISLTETSDIPLCFKTAQSYSPALSLHIEKSCIFIYN